MAVHPAEEDMRIHIQQGMFILHGRDNEGNGPTLEGENERYPQEGRFLHKLVIKGSKRGELAHKLDRLRIRWSDLFPDAGHLAEEINVGLL